MTFDKTYSLFEIDNFLCDSYSLKSFLIEDDLQNPPKINKEECMIFSKFQIRGDKFGQF